MADSDTKNPSKGDVALIAALLRGLSNAEASQEAGVSERTLYRRMQDPGFRRQLTNARSAVVAQTVNTLSAASDEAVKELQKLVTKAKSEHVRLGAARSVLEFSARLRESEELEQRLSELEEATEQQETNEWHRPRAG